MRVLSLCSLVSMCALGCGQGADAVSVELPVVVDSSGLAPSTTDLGYVVTVTTARVALRDVELSVGGETHDVASATKGVGHVYRGDYPHPGHEAGGDILGEMLGAFVIDCTADGAAIGVASALAGTYDSFNFTFRAADDGDGLAADDPLLGHTFHVEGVAEADGATHPFRAVLDVDAGTGMIGGYAPVVITAESSAPLGMQLLLTDPFEPDSVFDGIDFAALPVVDVDGAPMIDIRPGQPEHNAMRRNFQVHDHYQIDAR